LSGSTVSGPADAPLVLGTAGHIDHGKTALVRALTGVDTDRLPEEKSRGITIDLGFAPLDVPGRRLSVVDVPGHEGLVRTMVAGASGIDLVLLVVAADEGVMPQTREHVAICDLLGITRGVVALTKTDVAPADVCGLAEEEVRDLLAPTGLSEAPVVRVSAVSGVGVEEVRRALAEAAAKAAPRTPRSGPPRLSVDRAFSMRGFGCVVTGTLVGGAFRVGDAVELLPSGRRARVRGLQSHGESAERRSGGVRCAMNLHGIEVDDVSRGDVVTLPGALTGTGCLDVQLTWLAEAPAAGAGTSASLLSGTAERRARVAPIGRERIEPGSTGFARIHLDVGRGGDVAGEGALLAALPGDRFVLRGFARTESGGATLGGGLVLDVAPPHRRRGDPALVADLEALAQGRPAQGVPVRVRRAGFAGMSAESLRRETGLDADVLDRVLAELAAAGQVVGTSAGSWLGAEAAAELERRLLAALDAHHRAEPLLPGIPGAALRGSLPENTAPGAAERLLARLAERAELVVEGDRVRRPGHRAELPPEDRALAERMTGMARDAALEPPPTREWAQRLGVSPAKFVELAAYLARAGRMVRAGDLWFDAEAVAGLRERVVDHLKREGRLDTQTYKALIGTTRRTAVPLMELFDAERLTIRRPDARYLLDRGRSLRN
jgi:selenocysteine-specific elongation factor